MAGTQRVFDYVPFDIRVSMEVVPGFDGQTMGGRNENIDAGVPEDLIPIGGRYVWASGAEQLELVSDSLEDNPAGTGCGSVRVIGLLADYSLAIVEYDLDGLTPVLTDEAWLRVNQFGGVDAGSGADQTGVNSNVGTITATQQTSGIVMMNIPAAEGRARWAVATVPVGLTWIVDRFVASIGRAQATTAKVTAWTRPPGGIWSAEASHDPHSAGSSDVDIDIEFPFGIPERTDVRLDGDVSGNNSDLTGGIGGLLFDNDRFIVGN